MNKKDIVDTLSRKNGMTKKAIETIINGALDLIGEELSQKKDVSLVGFGVFKAKKRTERSGRNPNSGDVLIIPETYTPKFYPGKNLTEKVKGRD
ncbi:HU family DNA-binding protein [bacterium]|jgi:DNA-binding protein HU-beta|nr:HU family DNA-binding protein [bacterium]